MPNISEGATKIKSDGHRFFGALILRCGRESS
jgi:hypothetical protein